MMKHSDEQKLVVLLAVQNLGGAGTKSEVLDWIARDGLYLPSRSRLHVVSSREPAWRNDLAWARTWLVEDGALSNQKRNNWEITSQGMSQLNDLITQASSAHELALIERGTIQRLTGSHQAELSDVAALEAESVHLEGAANLIWTTRYERDAVLRQKAISLHGLQCQGCSFDFSRCYGPIGDGFIEVHHVKPISQFGKQIAVDPAVDLAVLCSNCHSIVHRRKGLPLSISELREIIRLAKV